jgi:hypothetical protein
MRQVCRFIMIKRLGNIFLFPVLFFGFSLAARAQNPTMDARWVEITNNGSTYEIQLQIKSTTASENLGNAVFIFKYDTANLSFPASPSSGTNYTFQNFNGSAYGTPTVTRYAIGEIHINVFFTGSSGNGTDISSGYTSVVNIVLTVKNTSGTGNITWWMNITSGTTLDDVFDDALNNFDENNFTGINSALPVSLKDFSALLMDNTTQIKWSTVSEINNAYFTIERGTNGSDFYPLLTMKGAGNSETTINYKAFDEFPLPGTSYYRLKQTDYNGKTETFDIVSINNFSPSSNNISGLSAFYSNNQVNVKFWTQKQEPVKLIIRDINGRIIQFIQVNTSMGNNQLIINNPNLQSGIYLVTVQAAKLQSVKLLIP